MKHNKYERKEKLFYKLEKEYSNSSISRCGYHIDYKLRNDLYHNFYDWFIWPSAPTWYRRMLNRKRRHSHKNVIYLIKIDLLDWENAIFDDNYRDSSRYW
jgi:hypothetical protein